MEGEARLPGFDAVAAQRVLAGGPGEPKRSRGQLAILEDFGMAERNRLTGRAANGQAQTSDEVLTEVENRVTVRGRRHVDGFSDLDPANRWTGWRDERREISFEQAHAV